MTCIWVKCINFVEFIITEVFIVMPINRNMVGCLNTVFIYVSFVNVLFSDIETSFDKKTIYSTIHSGLLCAKGVETMKMIRILLAVVVVFASFAFVPVPKTAEAVVGWVNVAGVTLTGTNGNVSNTPNWSTTGYGHSNILVLDSLGNPCIAWWDQIPGNNEIYFARWNGTGWVNVTGVALTATNGNVSNNPGSSVYPSLVLDPS